MQKIHHFGKGEGGGVVIKVGKSSQALPHVKEGATCYTGITLAYHCYHVFLMVSTLFGNHCQQLLYPSVLWWWMPTLPLHQSHPPRVLKLITSAFSKLFSCSNGMCSNSDTQMDLIDIEDDADLQRAIEESLCDKRCF